ncbi:lysozyme X [Drosophila sechellia]|uniref:lysozyme n=1 Tax=Drosophila sechellia TaxID=7238 RepID=B4HVN5_DROSE|nr:lysozyme X [Drosophila sechellia]EDW50000.1 GM14233 [Drosophila sechellia]
MKGDVIPSHVIIVFRSKGKSSHNACHTSFNDLLKDDITQSLYTRTGVEGPPNTDGSNDYGIFQINDLYWCQPPSGKFSHNGCGVSCNALLTDEIQSSVGCALKVLGQQGWSAWSTWHYCSGYLPSIDDCFVQFDSFNSLNSLNHGHFKM